MAQSFLTTDRVRLEVEGDPVGGMRNLVRNPTGELGSWDWITPVPANALNTTLTNNVWRLILGTATTGYTGTVTQLSPVKPGQWVGGSVKFVGRSTTAEGIKVYVEFMNAARSPVLTGTSATTTTLNATVYAPALQAPASAAFVRLWVEAQTSGANLTAARQVQFTEAAMVAASTSAAVTGFVFPAAPWVSILGPTHDVTWERSGFDVGMLSATIYSAALDPATSAALKPGRAVRVQATTPSGWESLFYGTARTASANYDLGQKDANRRTKISLTAVDAIATAANIAAPLGVGTIADLPNVFELSRGSVPWSVNGSSAQIANFLPAPVTTITDGSLADQVLLTRDSRRGYAWCDRRGIVNAWEASSMPTTTVAVLDESVYTNLDVDYNTDVCINTVTVKVLRNNLATGQVVEVAYGPFIDSESVDKWGAYSAEFTIQGVADTEAAASAYAQAILTANATPKVRVNGLSFAVSNLTDFSTTTGKKAFLDLYDRVQVKNTNGAIDELNYPTSIKHTLSAGGGGEKWIVDVGFSALTTVAQPMATPSASGGTVVSGDPKANTDWIVPTLQNGWTQYPDGWETVGYRRLNGIVYLRGLIQGGTAGGIMFTLPAGFRKSSGASHIAVPTGGQFGYINIFNTGAVAGNNNNNVWLSLANISFPADG